MCVRLHALTQEQSDEDLDTCIRTSESVRRDLLAAFGLVAAEEKKVQVEQVDSELEELLEDAELQLASSGVCRPGEAASSAATMVPPRVQPKPICRPGQPASSAATMVAPVARPAGTSATLPWVDPFLKKAWVRCMEAQMLHYDLTIMEGYSKAVVVLPDQILETPCNKELLKPVNAAAVARAKASMKPMKATKKRPASA